MEIKVRYLRSRSFTMIIRLPLLVVVLLGMVLVSVNSSNALFEGLFKRQDTTSVESPEPKRATESNVVATAPRTGTGPVQIRRTSDGSRPPAGPKKINLSAIRAAKNEQANLAAGSNSLAKIASRKEQQTGASALSAQDQAGPGHRRPRKPMLFNKHLVDDSSDDEFDDEIDNKAFKPVPRVSRVSDNGDELNDFDAIHSKSIAARKGKPAVIKRPQGRYVTSRVTGDDSEAREALMAKIQFNTATTQAEKDLRRQKAKEAKAEKERLKPTFKNTKFWTNKLDNAWKVGKKVTKATKNEIRKIPQRVGATVDKVNALIQLTARGKLMAIIEDVDESARYVRSEFSKFTVYWSPMMEQALDYLGDTNLNQISWNDDDEYDLRRDALFSLVFGYEFMKLMLIWRESLLVAHEAFKFWLEGLLRKTEAGILDLRYDLQFTPEEVQNYIFLLTWDSIEEMSLESRLNLDYLDTLSRPKDYRSKFFRHFTVLQEFYTPTMSEITRQKNDVRLTGNIQVWTGYFYEEFRNMVSKKQISVDVLPPDALSNLMDKLKPQLENTRLVYTTSFMEQMAQQLYLAQERRKMLESDEPLSDYDEDDIDNDNDADYEDEDEDEDDIETDGRGR